MTSRWQPPNALLFITSLFRPHLLRPDLRVPNIGYLDYRALRRAGFNAVVIDKDNCLTLPEQDELYPPLQAAWNQLLSTFEPGRVLVVSNSAGTKKDPGSIAAESVTLNLRTPLLLHSIPKPGCSRQIIDYFLNRYPPPTTLSEGIRRRHREAAAEELADRDAIVREFWDVAGGPILGPLKAAPGGDDPYSGMSGMRSASIIGTADTETASSGRSSTSGKDTKKEGIEAARDPATVEARAHATSGSKFAPSSRTSSVSPPSDLLKTASTGSELRTQDGTTLDTLRVLVIGDRLFTDTLLANRLRLLLPSASRKRDAVASTSETPEPLFTGDERVISVYTTQLPQPNDVRFLRWIEEKLSRGRLRESQTDWGRFVIDPDRDLGSADSIVAAPLKRGEGWRAYVPLRRQYLLVRQSLSKAPVLSFKPETWRPLPILVGITRGMGWLLRMAWTGSRAGAAWIYVQASKRIAEARATKVATAASVVSADGLGHPESEDKSQMTAAEAEDVRKIRTGLVEKSTVSNSGDPRSQAGIGTTVENRFAAGGSP